LPSRVGVPKFLLSTPRHLDNVKAASFTLSTTSQVPSHAISRAQVPLPGLPHSIISTSSAHDHSPRPATTSHHFLPVSDLQWYNQTSKCICTTASSVIKLERRSQHMPRSSSCRHSLHQVHASQPPRRTTYDSAHDTQLFPSIFHFIFFNFSLSSQLFTSLSSVSVPAPSALRLGTPTSRPSPSLVLQLNCLAIHYHNRHRTIDCTLVPIPLDGTSLCGIKSVVLWSGPPLFSSTAALPHLISHSSFCIYLSLVNEECVIMSKSNV
jgi:hypothetical protein